MEQYKGPRYQLIGPRCQVVKIDRGMTGSRIHVRIGEQIMILDAPVPDTGLVEFQDWVTLYTEIPVGRRQ